LPDGESKAEETKRMIDRVRTFIGYREYPKYGMVSRYFVYKQALLEEAERLVAAHVLRDKEDIFYLTFHELHEVVRTRRMDQQLIRQRMDAFRSYRFPPGPSKGAPASSETSPRPTSRPTTSSSPPPPIPAGHSCSSRSKAW
jgi:hypothetical protein